MSSIRATITDTLRGLVQRRLWPVAVLLVAAMVAVPVLLTADSEPADAPAEGAARAERDELAAAPIVTAASPAERESLRRVVGAAKDPFKPARAAKEDEDEPSKRSAGDRASEDAGATPPTASTVGGASGPTPPVTVAPERTDAPAPKFPTYSLSVRWGASEDSELADGVLQRLRALPSPEEPVVIYIGLTDGGKAAVFMVDESATPIGDGKCRPKPSDCQTVELRVGETEFFDVDLGDGNTAQYQLDVVKIHRKAVSSAAAARKARAAKAPKARRALAAISAQASEYRFDAGTGLLEPTRR